MREPTRANRRISLVAGLSVLFGATACQVQTFVLSPGTDHGWVMIEEGHESCPPLPVGTLTTEVSIPASRAMCTSTVIYGGWVFVRYHLADSQGGRTQLKIGELIHRQTGFSRNEGAPCHARGVQFYYGTKEELRQNPNYAPPPEYIAQYHPDCHGRW